LLKRMDSKPLFTRHPANPILHSGNVPYPATLVFNPGVVRVRDRYLMVFRYEYGHFDGLLLEHTSLGKAWSSDGVHLANAKIGPGAPPIRTGKNWLFFSTPWT